MCSPSIVRTASIRTSGRNASELHKVALGGCQVGVHAHRSERFGRGSQLVARLVGAADPRVELAKTEATARRQRAQAEGLGSVERGAKRFLGRDRVWWL